MNTIKAAVCTAEALNDFVSAIKDADITVDEMSEVSMLKPSFEETMTKIKEWAVVPPTDETPKKKRVCVWLSEQTRREIAKYVVDSCNGITVDKAVCKAQRKFSDISDRTIMRIVRKETFAKLTDQYYTVKNGVIHKK